MVIICGRVQLRIANHYKKKQEVHPFHLNAANLGEARLELFSLSVKDWPTHLLSPITVAPSFKVAR